MTIRILAVLSLLSTLTASAADVEVTTAKSPYDYCNANALDGVKDSAGTRFMMNDGAVLSITNDGSKAHYSHIWVKANCSAVLDVTRSSGTYIRLDGGITIEEGASLKIVGKTEAQLPLRDNQSTEGRHFARLQIAGLSFAATPDSTESIAGTVKVKGPGTIFSWPTDPNVTLSVDDGLEMAFYGDNTMAPIMLSDGVLKIDRTTHVLRPEACGEYAVSVPAGQQLEIVPVSDFVWNNGSLWKTCDGSENAAVEIAALAGELTVRGNSPVEFAKGQTFNYALLRNRDFLRYAGASDAGIVDGSNLQGDYPDATIETVGNVWLSSTDGSAAIRSQNPMAVILGDGEGSPRVFSGEEAPVTMANRGLVGLSPALWLDASAISSFAHTGHRTGDIPHEKVSDQDAAKFGQPLYATAYGDALVVERWFDCRDTERTGESGPWQIRYYGNNSFTLQVFPLLRTDAEDGMPYLYFGEPNTKFTGQVNNADGTKVAGFSSAVSSRLPFYKDNGSGNAPTSANMTGIKTVVMVFGSQQGGGFAFLGTTSGAFGRGNVTNAYDLTFPITTNETHAVWLNGTQVVPNETTYSGGWDILSADTEGLALSSLGGLTGNSNTTIDNRSVAAFGGQNYAEVMFFTEKLTDAERESVELYLAKKWKLTAKYPESRHSAQVMGTTGSVTVGNTKVSLSGNFAGMLTLENGADVEIANVKRPLSPTEVTDERLLWIDPNNESWCTSDKGGHVYLTYNGTSEPAAGDAVGYGNGSRAPNWSTCARGLGPTRRWIDFNNREEEVSVSNAGNTLRLQTLTASGAVSGLDAPLTAKTVIMVQDSVRGGGAPFLTATLGQPRRTTSDYHDNVWSGSNVPEAMTNAALRLNGESRVASDGFTGCPEVYSVVASEDMTVGAFGNIYTTQGYAFDEQRGEIQGEILVYRDALSGDTLAGLEAYLMSKWLNRLPAGYGDLSGATVTGAGTLRATSWAQMPKLDAAFAGTAAAESADAFDFEIAPDGSVVGAILAPEATLALPDDCTANVTLPAARLKAGTYTLVNCKSWGATTWTTSLTDPLASKREVTVSATDGKIVVSVKTRGFAITFR